MSLIQSNSAAVWNESAGSGAAMAVAPVHLVDDAGAVVPELVSVGSAEVAELVDWHGDRAVYELVKTGAPLVIVDNAGKLELADSGTPAAILVDDAGGLRLSTDLTQTPAGAFYRAGNGDIVAVRFDAGRQRLAQIGDVIITYVDT